MKIAAGALDRDLEQQLRRAYLVCGEENLLVLEAADRIRERARAMGFSERAVFHVDGARFDWASIQAESQSASLFASQRILDLRISGNIGREGAAGITALLETLSQDDLLLVTAGKVDRKLKWFKAMEEAGTVVECWPVKLDELPGWLGARMRARGLQPQPDAIQALAERVEGNLLAAAQEIDKLALLHGDAPLSAADVAEVVASSTRFDVFGMIQTAELGDPQHALRMLAGMQAEGAAIQQLAGAVVREVRLLYALRRVLDAGGNLQAEFRRNGVWAARQRVMQRAMRAARRAHWERLLHRCALLDRCIKGQADGDPWHRLDRIVVGLSGQA